MMNSTKLLFAAALAPAAIVAAAPAQAQVSGVAVVDAEQAMQDSTAWKNAAAQIQTTYKAQIDQARSRSTAIENELNPLVSAFQTARQAANADQTALQQQLQTIQTRQQAGNAEIARITEPVQRARAYALEQVSRQLQTAIRNVVNQQKVQVLVRPEALLYAAPAADLTAQVTAQINTLVPSVSITPPAGWQPGQGNNAAAGAAPAAPGAAAPAASPTPNGR